MGSGDESETAKGLRFLAQNERNYRDLMIPKEILSIQSVHL